MKSILILTFCFLPALGWGQEPAPRNPWKAAPDEMPEAVAKARVQASMVLKQAGGPSGGNLTLEVIEPPVLAAPVSPPAQSDAAGTGADPADSFFARHAAGPNEIRLFSPTVVVYPEGISLIKWWAADQRSAYQEYSAFVNRDLSSIHACGDLTTGRRRYCLLSVTRKSSDRFTPAVKPPALTDFTEPAGYILLKGDAANQEALEPLMALLAKYETESGFIESTAAAIRADQEARRKWEAENPEPPADTVIRFWPIQSRQYPTIPVN